MNQTNDTSLDVSIVVPTYCEADNLCILLPRLFEILRLAEVKGEVVVVDDDSPDATQQVCAELIPHFPLRLEIRKQERGLSSAVVRGFEIARGDVLVVMDADMSHPPEAVTSLIAALQDPHIDLVIGSRYIAGGSTDDGWGLFRWLNSKAATIIARPLTNIRDPMSGFFALRRSLLLRHLVDFDPIGFKIAHRVHCEM